MATTVTRRNENGADVTVSVGDVVRMRTGNQYLVVELPDGAEWPTGVGVAAGSSRFQDLMLDRIQRVVPGFDGSRQLASTINSLGLGSNMPERVGGMIAEVKNRAVADNPGLRTASAPTAAGTGNS